MTLIVVEMYMNWDGGVGVVPNSLQDIGRASDGAKRRLVKAEGCGTVHIYPC
jgi:hypothetical protein